jgi:hypothetical protein
MQIGYAAAAHLVSGLREELRELPVGNFMRAERKCRNGHAHLGAAGTGLIVLVVGAAGLVPRYRDGSGSRYAMT